MNELVALRNVHKTAKAIRSTAPVDDDFPEMMHYFDSAIRAADPLINTSDDFSLNALAEKQFDWVERMGWHNKTVLEALAFISNEVGEAINECRGESPSESFGEELADIILRTVDLAKWQDIDLEKEIANKMAINEVKGTRGRRI